MVTESELMKFKVPELKQKLQELGIQPRGLKADLAKQLAAAYNSIEQANFMQHQQQQQQQQQHHQMQQIILQHQQHQQSQFANQMLMVDQVREQQMQHHLQQQQQHQQQQMIQNQMFLVTQEQQQQPLSPQQQPMIQDLRFGIHQQIQQPQIPYHHQVNIEHQPQQQTIIPNQMFVSDHQIIDPQVKTNDPLIYVEQEKQQQQQSLPNQNDYFSENQVIQQEQQQQQPQPMYVNNDSMIPRNDQAYETDQQTLVQDQTVEQIAAIVESNNDDQQLQCNNQTVMFGQNENYQQTSISQDFNIVTGQNEENETTLSNVDNTTTTINQDEEGVNQVQTIEQTINEQEKEEQISLNENEMFENDNQDKEENLPLSQNEMIHTDHQDKEEESSVIQNEVFQTDQQEKEDQTPSQVEIQVEMTVSGQEEEPSLGNDIPDQNENDNQSPIQSDIPEIEQDKNAKSPTPTDEDAKQSPILDGEEKQPSENSENYNNDQTISINDKENDLKVSNENAIEVKDEEEEFQEDDQKKLLKALNLTEEEWSKMSKNHRRKLKKKLRNKAKRIERDEIEKRRQELRKQQKELEKQRQQQEQEMEIKQEQDDDDRMDIDEEDEPEEEKELKRLEELRKKQEELKKREKEKIKNEDTEVEIEYVPEEMPKDPIYLQFFKVFNKFSAFSADEAKRLEQERLAAEDRKTKADDRAKLLELKKPVELELKDDDEKDDEHSKLSKRKLKQITRMSVADLKQRVSHPELVEMHDVTAKDPVVLLYLKSTRNTVPVPRHWCYKRKYLQGKRGFEKPPFKLPEFIRRTGIQEMREAVLEKEDAKSLKTKMKEKIRPKMGKIDIDYQKLHDAFFKWQTKPKVTIHGDLYYEGKEFETRLKDKKPGELTNELRQALGMPTGPNAHKCPPPWLIAMQRYGPPPSYLSIKIPGLNAPIPEGCCFGYHAGGWGKPPVDEYGRPLYGDVFGATSANGETPLPEEEIDRSHWGEMESDDDDAEESEEEDEEEKENNDDDESGLVTPALNAEGLVTPSGISTGIPSGLETPDMIELRKRKQQIESEMESGGDQQQLFTVVPEKKVDRFAKDMMGSMHVYDFASLSKTTSSSKSNTGVEVALDPSELESGQLDSTAVAAKYEQTLRESSAKNPHEDLSDMVAEYASKQKRKKLEAAKHDQSSGTGTSGTSTSKSSKKYQFKF